MAEIVTVRVHLDRLQGVIEQNRNLLGEFKGLGKEQLNWKLRKGEWSVAQCLQHLIKINRSYFDTIEKKLYSASPPKDPKEKFNLSWKAKMAIKLNGPNPPFRIPTIKALKPSSITFDTDIVEQAEDLLKRELQVLEASRSVDIKRTIIVSPFGKMIQLNLGEMLALIAWHDNRHLLQAYKLTRLPEFPKA
ncbi:MAG: DinB family protein [Fimbriimonadaceae bacterium]